MFNSHVVKSIEKSGKYKMYWRKHEHKKYIHICLYVCSEINPKINLSCEKKTWNKRIKKLKILTSYHPPTLPPVFSLSLSLPLLLYFFVFFFETHSAVAWSRLRCVCLYSRACVTLTFITTTRMSNNNNKKKII